MHDIMSTETKLVYLKLLCEFNPDKVLRMLKMHNFPLDDSLELIRGFKIFDAIAYLDYKSGRVSEALSFLQATLKENLFTVTELEDPEDYDTIEDCLTKALQEYYMSVEIIVSAIEEPKEAQQRLRDFIHLLLDEYSRVEIIPNERECLVEEKLILMEIRKVIFTQMVIESIMVYARGCETRDLMEIFDQRLITCRINEFSEFLLLKNLDQMRMQEAGKSFQGSLYKMSQRYHNSLVSSFQ